MDCRTFQHNLMAYQEDNLQPAIKRDMDIHLSECKSCEHILSGFQSVEYIIEDARKKEPNPFIATRIVQYIENELTDQRMNRWVVIKPVLYTFSLLFAIVIGFAVGRAGSERINGFGTDSKQSQIENLKTGLYIHDFIDENKTLFVNE